MRDGRTRASMALRPLLRLLALPVLVPAVAFLWACESSVVFVVEVAEVEVSPSQITLLEGQDAAVSAILRAHGGQELSGRSVTWRVEDPERATITPEGLLKGKSPGSTRIHASSDGVSGTGEVTVLAGPAIGLSTAYVELRASADGDPPTEEIEIHNAGNGTLDDLTVEARGLDGGSVPWLEAELLATTAPTRLRLHVSMEEAVEGSHEALLIVKSSVVTAGPMEVRVRLSVEAAEPEPGPCDIRNHTFIDDFEIPRDTSCTFTNVYVQGDLEVGDGASLTATELRVRGDFEAKKADVAVVIDSRLEDDVKLTEGGSVTIRDSYIGGKLELKSNLGPVDVRDNTVGEDVQLDRNRGGPFTLFRNTIDAKLECKDNVPAPTGAGNEAADGKRGQCRKL